jgi:hypothetical protein
VNLYADKLVRHITDTGFAYRLNHTMHLGGSGDNNMHVRYADSIANYLDEFAGPRYAHSSQCSEVGDSQRIREWFLKEISNTQMAFYFGHSTSYALDGTLKMVSIEDTYRVRNKENPVMFFACCDVADADRGTRGLGETMVVATKYGVFVVNAQHVCFVQPFDVQGTCPVAPQPCQCLGGIHFPSARKGVCRYEDAYKKPE